MFTAPPLRKKARDHIQLHNMIPEGDFKNSFDIFSAWVRQTAEVKRVGGREIDGETLATYLEACTRCINERGDIVVPSVLAKAIELRMFILTSPRLKCHCYTRVTLQYTFLVQFLMCVFLALKC